MFRQLTRSNIPGRLAIAGLLLAVLSALCGPCMATVAGDRPAHAGEPSGDCHPGVPADEPAACECDCPALVAAKQWSTDSKVLPSSIGPVDPPLRQTIASIPRGGRVDAEFRPGNRPAIPRLSPVKSFGIRLE